MILKIDINTQSLRIEIESAKRQRLNSSLKKVKQDIISPCQECTQLRYELDALKRYMGETHHNHGSRVARVSSVAFRCLSRVHQLLITFTPFIPMTAEAHAEISQLNYELYRSVEQIKIPMNNPESTDV